ncbi:HTH domain-containing protein [Pseudomonas paraeruginosa]|uniref:HTH domain-containing protein n=1 Tax=Pseudomonas paraeruginosa TaxID=2994495 RepID=UPI0039FBF738
MAGHVLAGELGVSLGTLYRDIVTLQRQGAYIEGGAGLGYLLRPGFELPPLMFPWRRSKPWRRRARCPAAANCASRWSATRRSGACTGSGAKRVWRASRRRSPWTAATPFAASIRTATACGSIAWRCGGSEPEVLGDQLAEALQRR